MENIRNELKLFDGIIKEIDALYSELARRSGLSDSSFWVLYYLTQLEEEITQKSICEQWALSKQTVNNAINDLLKKGYIYLLESKSDRRSKEIFLTESGERFTEIHIKKIFSIEESIFSEMSREERANIINSNKKYLNLLRKELQK
ncbi:MAG: MarR family transcriptional regulator [Oscillospiraceae bacterium]